VCGGCAAAFQHPLTEAARREAARRATVPKAERLLTNADLDVERRQPSVMVDSGSVLHAQADASVLAGTVAEPRPGEASVVGERRAVVEGSPDAASVTVAPHPSVGPADALESSGRDETWWRQRAEALARQEGRLSEQRRAVQNRIDMLAADIAGRDDPYRRATLEEDRRRALDELEALGRDADELVRTIHAFEESARRQAIPAAWTRTAPD
jgi:hypothetical protein